MVRAYFRCNGGDYFCDEPSCPFDGWASPGLEEFLAASKVLRERGERPSLDAFRKLGVSIGTLERMIVVEFGSEGAAFEALSPGTYIQNGVERKAGDLGSDLT
jgi:hypothetical protein